MSNQLIATPSRTKEILKKYNIRLKKRMGQNFLIDPNIMDIIIDAADINNSDTIIEIGPGIGGLTERILHEIEDGHLIAIEKDKKLVKILQELFADPGLEIIEKDARDVNWKTFLEKRGARDKTKVIANLPYYITTPIIMGLLEEDCFFPELVFMVQKEVAERMAADSGTKEYGSLSVAVQFYAQVEVVHHVPPTVFIPSPEVHSSIVKLKSYQESPFLVEDKKFFFSIVKAIFQQRRKNLKNALSKAANIDLDRDLVISSLDECGIDRQRRGEKLSVSQMVDLSNSLLNNLK